MRLFITSLGKPRAILNMLTALDLSFGVDSKGAFRPRHGPGPSPRYGPIIKAGTVSCQTETSIVCLAFNFMEYGTCPVIISFVSDTSYYYYYNYLGMIGFVLAFVASV